MRTQYLSALRTNFTVDECSPPADVVSKGWTQVDGANTSSVSIGSAFQVAPDMLKNASARTFNLTVYR